MSKILLIGPTTRDIIKCDGKIVSENLGGTVYYAAAALAAIGESCRVLTCCSSADRNLLTKHFNLPGVSVDLILSKLTMQYENETFSDLPNMRNMRVLAVSDPFSENLLVDELYDAIHLGPLLNSDISLAFVQRCRVLTPLLTLDAQGILRELSSIGTLPPIPLTLTLSPRGEGKISDCHKILALIDIVKFSEEEAAFFAGTSDMRKAALIISDYGPREVVITLGDKGSLIYCKGDYYKTPASPVVKVIDTTGCGDTFMAAYLSSRLKGKCIDVAAEFANKVAAIKAQIMGSIKSL